MIYGPPGSGKTMLARALARYHGWSAMPRIDVSAFSAGVEDKPIAPVSDIRAKLDAIQVLTHVQSDLYRDFCVLAERRSLKPETVPLVSDLKKN